MSYLLSVHVDLFLFYLILHFALLYLCITNCIGIGCFLYRVREVVRRCVEAQACHQMMTASRIPILLRDPQHHPHQVCGRSTGAVLLATSAANICYRFRDQSLFQRMKVGQEHQQSCPHKHCSATAITCFPSHVDSHMYALTCNFCAVTW